MTGGPDHGRSDRLRARSGVEDLPPLVLWMYRTWWVTAAVTLFIGGVAVEVWATEGLSSDVAVPGVLALFFGLASAYQFRDWRRHRARRPPPQREWARPWLD